MLALMQLHPFYRSPFMGHTEDATGTSEKIKDLSLCDGKQEIERKRSSET